MNAEYRSFREFYPAYLAEHKERATRRLHFLGTLLVIVVLVVALWKRDARWLLLAPVFGLQTSLGSGTSPSSEIVRPRSAIRSTAWPATS